jgi:hypothetical protein
MSVGFIVEASPGYRTADGTIGLGRTMKWRGVIDAAFVVGSWTTTGAAKVVAGTYNISMSI